MAMRMPADQSLADRYLVFDTNRSWALHRKKEHASVTIPSLLPFHGQAQTFQLDVPYNSTPAEGINALAARMMAVILPLNDLPVFEMVLDEPLIPQGRDPQPFNEVFRRFERRVMDVIRPTNARQMMFLGLKHTITLGDVLFHQKDNFNLEIFRVDEFVVRRTRDGEWREIIIELMVDPELQDDRVRNIAKRAEPAQSNSAGSKGGNLSKDLEPLYIRIWRDGEESPCFVTKEFRGVMFEVDQPEGVCSWFPVQWNHVIGEDTGTSLVEDSFGDIRALDGLTAALIDGTALNSEYRWGVNPAGFTEIADLERSVNGDWVSAAEGDVFPLAFQNGAQVAVTQEAVTRMERRIDRRFLRTASIQRPGERVTAREISIMAQDLEQGLGGTLSMLNRDLILPYIRSTIAKMARLALIPPELEANLQDPESILKFRIRSGLEILNREAEREQLLAFGDVARNLPPEAGQVIHWDEFIRRLFAAGHMEPTGLIKSKEDVAREQQAAAQREQAMLAQQGAQEAALAAAQAASRNSGEN